MYDVYKLLSYMIYEVNNYWCRIKVGKKFHFIEFTQKLIKLFTYDLFQFSHLIGKNVCIGIARTRLSMEMAAYIYI